MAVVHAQEDRPQDYLVELIVFSHASGQPDSFSATELQDFSERLDPLKLAEAERAAIEAAEEFRRLSANPQTGDADHNDSLPEPYLALPELSEPMQSALDRLNRSGHYNVLASRAWLQTAERSQRSRWLRLHDEQPIDWPSGNTDSLVLSLDEEPTQHYRLDGQTRLRRTQFLNLTLNLEWRESAGRPVPVLVSGSNTEDAEIELEPTEQAMVWRVHRFEQSRAVRVDRLEYFDSEWIGVLALVSLVEPPPEPEVPELNSDGSAESAEQPVDNF